MASGGVEPKAGPSDEAAAVSSPGPDQVAAAPGTAGDDDEAAAPAVTSPAPAPAPAATTTTTRPYYECVFCKRGFTTAQALGGHMNIHRRDRGKPGRDATTGLTSAPSTSRNVESYNQYHHLAPPYPPAQAPRVTASTSSSFTMFYRGTGAVTGLVDGDQAAGSPSSARPKELTLFGAAARDHDLHLGLGCHDQRGGGDGPRAAAEGSSERQATGEPERELDLELRLGRRPRH